MEKENKYFKNQLSDVEVKPSVDVWNKIDGELDKSASQSKKIYFIRIAASMSLLLVSSFIVFQLLRGNASDNVSDNTVSEEASSTESFEEKIIENKIALNENQDEEEDNEVIEEVKEEKVESKSPVKITKKSPSKIKTQEKVKLKKKIDAPKVQKKESYHQNIEINSTERFGSIDEEIEEKKEQEIKENIIQKEEVLLADNTKKKSRSVTIILEPKKQNDDQELLAMNESEDKKAWKKIRRAMSKDLYKQKINLGSVPKVELNKFKIGSN